MPDGIKDAVQSILDVSYDLYNDNSEIYSAISRLSSMVLSSAVPGEQIKEKVIGEISKGQLTAPILGGKSQVAEKSPLQEEKSLRLLEMSGKGKVVAPEEEEQTKVMTSVLTEAPKKQGELTEAELQKLAGLQAMKAVKKQEDEEMASMMTVHQPVIQKEKEDKEALIRKEETKLRKIEETSIAPSKSAIAANAAAQKEGASLLTSLNLEEAESKNPLVKMLKIIKSRKSINLSELAHELGYDKTLVERWAKVLSVSDLIKIKYPFVGEMILEA